MRDNGEGFLAKCIVTVGAILLICAGLKSCGRTQYSPQTAEIVNYENAEGRVRYIEVNTSDRTKFLLRESTNGVFYFENAVRQ